MNKLKKTRYGLYSTLTLLLVVCVAFGVSVYAFSGTINNVENYYEAQPMQDGGDLGRSFMSNNPFVDQNGDSVWVVKGTCDDASVDIFSFANPWGTTGSTTVVDAVRVRIDGVATTSYVMTCGAQTAENATPSYDLMTSSEVATSSMLGCVIENGLLTADNGDSACPDGGSVSKISLGTMFPYFGCELSSGGSGTNGITNPNNTFACEYMVRLKQMR